MDTFEASNGVTVKRVRAGLYVQGEAVKFDRLREKLQAGSYGDFTPAVQDALREFFQHERDEEIGRWRWPENPEYVVYHAKNVNGDHKVMRESDGHGMFWGRDMAPAPHSSDDLESAAHAYFEAHPEPKPWHEAKPWETWVFTIDGKEQSATLDEDREFRDRSFHTCSWMHVKDDRISAGRRIWPESD